MYTDYGLLTTSKQLTYEASLFFNAITGYSSVPGLHHLFMAPHALKPKLLELIRREASISSKETPGRLVAKMNSLCDPEMIEALYEASKAHVRVDLIVRGICTLIPQVKGMSEHIRVVSVVDRYLEHTRVFWFHNGGMDEVYLASADWMPRNLDRRVELMFPLLEDDLIQRVKASLDVFLTDNCKAHDLKPDGSYTRRTPADGAEPIRAQETLYRRAEWRAATEEAAQHREFTVRRKPPAT